MPNGTYGGVRGKETKIGQKIFVSRPTRFYIPLPLQNPEKSETFCSHIHSNSLPLRVLPLIEEGEYFTPPLLLWFLQVNYAKKGVYFSFLFITANILATILALTALMTDILFFPCSTFLK